LFGSGAAAEAALRAAGVDPTLRGERLDVVEFARIAEQLPPSAVQPAGPAGTVEA
jgi:16S rRNA (adenine1518-N6/adenine1519-N6)-dimethyltransferase